MLIKIPTGNPEVVFEVIRNFNNSNKTDFTVHSTENLDGVVFVFVNKNSCNPDDIFSLGYQYGLEVEYRRANHQINW